MNKIEIEGSGFPATNKTWRFIRDMINEVHQLTAFGGTTYILKGCEEDNGNIADGYIVYNGELLPFQGSALGAKVTIVEAVEQTTYLEDLNSDGVGDDKDTYFERYAKFGNDGVVTFNWADLERLNPLLEVQRRLPPKKCALPYWGDGTDLAEGWQFCDGTNGTPDLREKFIVGHNPDNPDYNTIGKQGGAEKVILTESEIPSHKHGANVVIPPHNHQHKDSYFLSDEISDNFISGREDNLRGFYATGRADNNNRYMYYKNRQTENSRSVNVSFNTANKGGGESHENRPPYYTMAYITDTGI